MEGGQEKKPQALSYVMVDGQGKKLTEIITVEEAADLSDCQPIVSGNKVIWYSTKNSVPHFYEIDIETKTLSITDAHIDNNLTDEDLNSTDNNNDKHSEKKKKTVKLKLNQEKATIKIRQSVERKKKQQNFLIKIWKRRKAF